MSSHLQDVLDAMENVNRGKTDHIDGNRVREWMKSDDIRTLGAVYYILFDGRYYPRIRPSLTLDEYKSFLLPYYARCFREDPEGDWVSTRYTAGWDFARWFMTLWRDNTVPRSMFEEIKKWLGDLYLISDDAVRDALVTATLEHLFENKKVATFFSDWSGDPELRDAYSAAMQWSQHGGRTPLTEK